MTLENAILATDFAIGVMEGEGAPTSDMEEVNALLIGLREVYTRKQIFMDIHTQPNPYNMSEHRQLEKDALEKLIASIEKVIIVPEQSANLNCYKV